MPTHYARLTGVPFAAITQAEAVETIIDAATARRGHWTITANLDHLRRYRYEKLARELMDSADLIVADGMPVIWASKFVKASLPERVAGSSMVWSICEAASDRHLSVFLLGGDPGVADRAARVLTERYEGLEIAGTLCPPMGFENDADELDRVVRETAEACPRIVFVALGFPKQDCVIQLLRAALPSASLIGVGISLSFVTGEVSRAPAWVRALGMEWLYRLQQEPRRLARRYLVEGVPFALRLLGTAGYHRLRRRRAGRYWGWEADRASSRAAYPTGSQSGSQQLVEDVRTTDSAATSL